MCDSEFVTPEEKAHYSSLFRQPWLSDIARVFHGGEEELFDLLRRLRSKPGYISFSLSSGTSLQFLTVERKWVDRELRLLLSDGTVGGFHPICFPCGRVVDEDMVRRQPRRLSWEEEFLPSFVERVSSGLDAPHLPVEECALPASEETKNALKHFGWARALARTTVEQLARFDAPIPDDNFAIIARQWQKTGETSPKELLLSALEEAVNSGLSARLSGERLWGLLYDGANPMDMAIREFVLTGGYQAREPTFRWKDYRVVMTRSILNLASQFDDLVTTPLWSHPVLDVTLRTAYKEGFLKPERVGDTLADRVATRLGFQRVANGWVKSKEGFQLHVTGDGDVYLNEARLCIQPVEHHGLPRGDIVASVLMTLATDLRLGVLYGPDLEAIEALLPLEESLIALKGLIKEMEGGSTA